MVITPSKITQATAILKDNQQNDLDYDLKDRNEDNEDKDDKLFLLSFKLSISTCFKLSIMARLPLSQEEVNNSIMILLLKRNRQFIGHHLHPTTTEIRMDSRMLTLTVQQLLGQRFNTIKHIEIFELGAIIDALTTNQVLRMLRDMSIDAPRELRGVSLDKDNINLDDGNNSQQNNPNDRKKERTTSRMTRTMA
ncbi:hypothetical protein Pint_14584 [Pistacia integerrima]|uniref:Uncharacterized protein n=1 Tax=Pistacia integerrima TaxID=434235 RepID=A0ACC0YBG6_9ROSI|nr:hypothetical protein Pint_14584 [Pistacia integerrima]